MKILKLSTYCYPEQVSSSHLTSDLHDAFVQAGWTIENYVPMPSRGVSEEVRAEYKNKREEVRLDGHYIIHRFPMIREGKNPVQRALKYLLTNIVQYFKAIRTQGVDLVYCSSTPPTQGVLCALVARKLSKRYGRHVPFVFNLQDIFPDSLVNAKMTRKGSLIWKIGRKLEDFIYRSADTIIVINDDFKRNIMEKGVPAEKIVVVQNWVDTDKVYPIPRAENILFDRYGLDREKFYVCYSGNVGHSQNLTLLRKAANMLRTAQPAVQFVIIGEGAAKEELIKAVETEGLTNVTVLPFQPYAEIAHVFSLGDVGLIISKPGIGGSSVPSKTWSIMGAARPIIASFDNASELSKLVESIGCGLVAEADDAEALVHAIQSLYNDPDARARMGKAGRDYLLQYLSKEFCTGIYVDAIRAAAENAGRDGAQ